MTLMPRLHFPACLTAEALEDPGMKYHQRHLSKGTGVVTRPYSVKAAEKVP